jgi:RNA polymerase sigma-70 factor (ECF subfamily)
VTLVDLARGGSARAFELLVERHRLRIFCIAMRYTRNPDDAGDLCQETMTRAWERLHTLHEPQHFPRWLEQIAIHLCLDARRRAARAPAAPLSFDASVESPHDAPQGTASIEFLTRRDETARETVLENEITAHLLRAIEALPATLRDAAYLRFIEGLKGEEIAARLHIEYDAAKKRVYRATLELRRRLQPLYDELMGSKSP